jgi:hypothetical protein
MRRPDGQVNKVWHRGWLAFNELAVHSVVILCVVLSIEGLGQIIGFMHHSEWIFFKAARFEFPARWLFDAADMSMLGVLMLRGTIVLWRVYKG